MSTQTLPRPVSAPRERRLPLFWWLPLALVAMLYIGASVGPALFDENEAQYAGAAREMLDRPQDYQTATRGQLERGHWYIPTNDGIPRLQKPPLVYWLLMASMRVFGVNAFAARLPNALFSLLWFAGTFLIGRRIGGNALGAAAATILATMTGTFIFCHLIAPEPFLAAFLTLTFWCLLSACQQPAAAPRWMLGAWLCMALGVECKGLHGALYPLAVAGWLAWRHPGTRPVWKLLLRPAGPLLFLAIVAPWYAAMEVRYPGFLHDQLINEQVGHVFNNRFPRDSARVPLLVFCLEHLVFFLPWTFFIPAALSARLPGKTDPGSRLGRDLLTCWFWVTAVSLLFSSLQDYYLLTAWGSVALWLARPWADAGDLSGKTLPRWRRMAPGLCLAVLGVLLLVAAGFLRARTSGDGSGRLVSVSDTLAGTVAGFSVSAWGSLLPLAWATAAILIAGGVATLWLAWRGRWTLVLPVTALMSIAVLFCAARGLSVVQDYFSLKRIAMAANRHAGAGAMVVCCGEPADNPSLLFYIDRQIYWVSASPQGEFASRVLQIGTSLFLPEADFARQWHSSRTVFLVARSETLAHWQQALALSPAQAQPVARSGMRVLLVNHAGARPTSQKSVNPPIL